jgi:membrane associated rhomboid family serine protease
MSSYSIPCCRRGSWSNNGQSSFAFAMHVAIPFIQVMSLLFVVPFLASFLYHYMAHTRGLIVVTRRANTRSRTNDDGSSPFIISLYGRHQPPPPPAWNLLISNNKNNNIQEEYHCPHIFSWTASALQRQGPLVDIYTASKILSSSSSSSSSLLSKYSSEEPPLIFRKQEQHAPQQQSEYGATSTSLNSTPSWCISLHAGPSSSSDDDDEDLWWCKTRSANIQNNDDDEYFSGIYHPSTTTTTTATSSSNTNGTINAGKVVDNMVIVQDASSWFGPRLQLPSLIPLPTLSRLIFSSWPSTTENNNVLHTSQSRIVPDIAAASDGTSSSSSSSSMLFRRNPNKQQASSSTSENSSWKQLLSRPAFVLLATLQLVLAWLYWERNVPVMNVAMHYPQMSMLTTIPNSHSIPQVWRALSGSTAHFNLWHLGLNMMSLHQLSLDIERSDSLSSSSIVYFMTNLSFIAIVSAVWMLLQHGKERFHQYQHQQRLQQLHQQHEPQIEHSPTVGYSGVLFAWSVVATTLVRGQQYQSCPIPFLDTFCFGTTNLFGYNRFPFSWAPLIQLALAQVMLPNVSWTGHLAGIIVGYAWTWNVLALPWLASHVELTWPTLHFLSILLAMRRYHHQSQHQEHQRESSSTAFLSSSVQSQWRVFLISFFSSVSRFLQSTCILGKMHATIAFLAVLVWGPLHALTLSSGLVFSCWYVLERQQAHATIIFTQPNNNNASNTTMANTKQSDGIFVGALVRCYMAAVVLNLVNTSMTVGLWWSLPSIWILQQSPIALLLVPLQCMTLLLGLFRKTAMAVVNKETTNTADFQTGIFHYTFGIALVQPMTETRQRLHQWLQHVQSSTSSQQGCLDRFLSTCVAIIDGATDPRADGDDDDSHGVHSIATTTSLVSNVARNRNGTSIGSTSRLFGGGGHVAFSGDGQRLGGATANAVGANRESESMV